MAEKCKYGLTKRKRVHGGERLPYYGILKYPKSCWSTKEQAKKSRGYQILKKLGYEPRVVKKR